MHHWLDLAGFGLTGPIRHGRSLPNHQLTHYRGHAAKSLQTHLLQGKKRVRKEHQGTWHTRDKLQREGRLFQDMVLQGSFLLPHTAGTDSSIECNTGLSSKGVRMDSFHPVAVVGGLVEIGHPGQLPAVEPGQLGLE